MQLTDFEFPQFSSPFEARSGIVRHNRRYVVRRCFDFEGGAYARGVVGGAPPVVFEHQASLMLTEDELRCTEICERIWALLDERHKGEVLEVIVQHGEVTLAGDQTFSLELLAAAEATLDHDGAKPNVPAHATA